MEEELMSGVVRDRLLISANMLAHPRSQKETIKEIFESFKDYVEILLPSTKKQANMKDMSPNSLAAIKARLKELKASLQAKKKL